jgi:hypothetical protein
MGWDLLRDVQKQTDIRLIFPLGLTVRVGDIIRVGKDGTFSLQGSTKSILDIARPSGKSLSEGRPADQTWTSGEGTKLGFRGSAAASTLFTDLPEGSAGFDITFASADTWLLVLAGRKLVTFTEANSFRQPILDAFKRKVWQPDWALVTEVAYADKMTFLAAEFGATNVFLALAGSVNAKAALTAQLTTGAWVAASSNKFVQSITDDPGPVGVRATRIRDVWWKRLRPQIGDLKEVVEEPADAEAAFVAGSDDDIWQDSDPPIMRDTNSDHDGT